MSSLYGHIASAPTRIDCRLIKAQQSMIRRSYSEGRNVDPAFGWGAAVYRGSEEANTERKAFCHPYVPIFESRSMQEGAQVAIASLLAGPGGKADRRSVHPFTFETWTFAMTGSIENFQTIRREILGEMTPEFRRKVQGGSDPEHIFYLFLSYLKRSAGSTSGDAPINRIREALTKSILMLNQWSDRTGTKVESGIGIITTNRRAFLAYRQYLPLYFTTRDTIEICPICARKHAPEDDPHYRSVVVTRTPTTLEKWKKIPDRHILMADPDLAVSLVPVEEEEES